MQVAQKYCNAPHSHQLVEPPQQAKLARPISNRPGQPLVRDEKASTVAAIRAFTNLWAAAHPVDQRVAG